MSYHIKRKESLIEGVRRVAQSQIKKAIAEVEDASLDVHETVHQVRKRCKKIRALLRLTRPGFKGIYQRENKTFRDAARSLSTMRDAQAMIETYDMLLKRYDEQVERRQFGTIRARLTRRMKKLAEEEVDIEERLEKLVDVMQKAKSRLKTWELDEEGFDPAAAGLKKTYCRGRDAMKQAYRSPSPESFHEWRKRVKYYRYQLRIMRELWPEVLNATRKQAHELSDCLGDDHNLAVFRAELTEAPSEWGDEEQVRVLLGLIDQYREDLETDARPLGERLYAEKPKYLLRRLDAYWSTWKERELELAG